MADPIDRQAAMNAACDAYADTLMINVSTAGAIINAINGVPAHSPSYGDVTADEMVQVLREIARRDDCGLPELTPGAMAARADAILSRIDGEG